MRHQRCIIFMSRSFGGVEVMHHKVHKYSSASVLKVNDNSQQSNCYIFSTNDRIIRNDWSAINFRQIRYLGTSKKLNEFGHEYTQIGGPINASVLQSISEIEIHSLIKTRSECRNNRDYQQADKIRNKLQQHGVIVSDRGKVWRADGKMNDYVQVGGPIDTSVCHLSEIEINNLIRARSECRGNRDFEGADKILDELQQHGVFISDDAKIWRADGKVYDKIGGPIDTSVCGLSENEINNLIRTRMQCRSQRDYEGADKIRAELEQNGISINDDARVWRADKK